MQQVDIYLYPSSRAPKLKEGSYYWKARCRGIPREGTGQAGECTSGQSLILLCATAALKIVIRPAMITIHTDSYYLVGNHKKLQKWKDNGWKKQDGTEARNADLWQQIMDLESPHAIKYQLERPMPKREEI